MWRRRVVVVLLSIGGVVFGTNPITTHATSTLEVVGPANSQQFGRAQALVLSNGNYVVTDPLFDGAGVDEGAVYLYEGATNHLISTLTGSVLGDRVGGDGVFEVGNSNFVVVSRLWDAGVAASNAGAVTWVSGSTGLSGEVSAVNSLVGTTASDGNSLAVTALTNGNYVVAAPFWDGAAVDVGAATWGNGATGVSGPITPANSLVGTTLADEVGISRITPLTNGNYVVPSGIWDGTAVNTGAATWGDGTAGTTGPVTAANSLVGTTANDHVGDSGVTALTNGNYVVPSPFWDGTAVDTGAATWGNGTAGTTGPVSPANSLVGTHANDYVGYGSVTALTNGNYVVKSMLWDDGAITDVGASTWGNGTIGVIGSVSPANSLVGTTAGDQIGGGVAALTNGNYVVASFLWDNGAIVDAGASTWGNGTTGITGPVTPANSLVGTTAGDEVGILGATALTNGNYVVGSEWWDNGAIVDAGASTWGNGTTGITGPVTSANSLVGTTANDLVGLGNTALTNGNYVLGSDWWDNGAIVDAGAATWGNGTTGISGPVTAANSLVGTHDYDFVSTYGVTALTDGNYIVNTPSWSGGFTTGLGAVTWGNGTTGISGAVTAVNSLVGTGADQVGDGGITAYANGNYAVFTRSWDNGAVVDAGAVTFGPVGGITGTINASNSALGTAPSEIIYASKRLTGDNALVVSTTSNRVILLRAPDLDFMALAPARLAETRAGLPTVDGLFDGGGIRPTGSTLALTVAGRGGVAANATAVSLNVTVANPAGAGFVTVYPCGSTQPTASNLNYTAGAVVPNAVIAKIGSNGQVCVFVSMATDLIVDVNGYFPTTTSLASINPARVLETRPGLTTSDGQQQAIGARAGGSVTAVQIGGRATVPNDASAVVLNVTVTGAQGPGFVTVYPCGTSIPTASNINYVTGSTVANLVVAKIGNASQVCIFTSNTIDLIADVNGYFPAKTTYRPLDPARLLETRAGLTTIDAKFQGDGQRPQNGVLALDVTGRGGVPAEATTAVLNITVTGPTGAGFITAYPCGITPPLASNLNYDTNTTVANAVIVKIGTNGQICLLNSAPTDLIVDVAGYIN